MVVLAYVVYAVSAKNITKTPYRREGVSAYTYSYWGEGANGSRIVEPRWIEKNVSLHPKDTAIVIIDPWNETSSKKLNADTHKNIMEVVKPLVDSFLENKVRKIYIFTSEYPNKTTISIDEELMQYVNRGEAKLCYHQNHASSKEFVEELNSAGIQNVIYFGYAINLCVLYRKVGVVPVHFRARDLNCFIVPEATLALVNENDVDNQVHRDAICLMLAQNSIAKIIHAEDLLNYNWE